LILQPWTILDEGGRPGVKFTSFIDIDLSAEAKVLEYPIEEGSFASYNKTQQPTAIRVTLAAQGSNLELNDMLSKLKDYKEKAVKLSILTPSDFYEGYALEGFSYKRERTQNANMLAVELAFKEVREVKTQVTTQAISKPKNPTSAGKVDTGRTQSQSALDKIKKIF
jgi:hypothetical protein